MGILNIEMKEAEPVLAGVGQGVRHGIMGLAVGTESAAQHGVAVVGQRPMEGDVVFQVEEVVAVHDMQHVAIDTLHKGTGIVVLQLVVVGQGRAVGIKQSVGAASSIISSSSIFFSRS